MFYLRWIFFVSLLISSNFSLATAGDFGEPNTELTQSSSFRFSETANLYPGVVNLILTNERGRGTGFFIGFDMIATAAHVANKGPLYFRDPSTGEPVYTEVLEIDEVNDVALLQAINYESEHFYSIGFSKTDTMRQFVYEQFGAFYFDESKKGDFATIPGFPHGSFNIVQGTILKTPDFPFVAITHKTNTKISHFSGISGAPVFSKDNKVIGVATAGNEHDNNLELIVFTPVEGVRYLVGKAEVKETENLLTEIQIKKFKLIHYILSSPPPKPIVNQMHKILLSLTPEQLKELAPFLLN